MTKNISLSVLFVLALFSLSAVVTLVDSNNVSENVRIAILATALPSVFLLGSVLVLKFEPNTEIVPVGLRVLVLFSGIVGIVASIYVEQSQPATFIAYIMFPAVVVSCVTTLIGYFSIQALFVKES